ncbi:MAG: MATE family efflux transporter, partial [Clostridia bacterium]|nr:MATE family efflux transporter [Clostridia bacterium]
MTSGVAWKHILNFAIPMAVGLLFQQLYNTVDTIVVGRFVGAQALAAVGSTTSIVNMLVGMCAGLATGASVAISQCYGSHDGKGLSDAVHTSMAVTAILCVAVTAVGVIIVRPMLDLMDTPADVYPEAQTYLTIYFAGVSGLLIYNMGSGILRAVGDSRRPLYFLFFSAAVNVVFDLLFVIVFKMGVAGVAYATIISQFLSCVLVMLSLTRTHDSYGVRLKKIRLNGPMARRILSVGLPSGLQQMITSFSNVFVQSYINFFGSACMAGWSCYNKLDVFALIPVQSIALASTTFVGQNFGANHIDRARSGVRSALFMSIGTTVVISAVMIAMSRQLVEMFSTEMEVIEYGEYFMMRILPFYFLICFNQVLSGAMRGIGDAKAPTIIMLLS